MGRPKGYDRDEVLERAMEQFWLHGYDATSTTELAECMGINRYSMYAEFESKHALYQAALARYRRRVVPAFIGELQAPDAGLAAIAAVYTRFATTADADGSARWGCMLFNAAAESSARDPDTRAQVESYVAMLEAAFERALRTAVARGELRPDVDPTPWARKLTTTLIGVFVLIRSHVGGAVARDAALFALHELEQLAPAS